MHKGCMNKLLQEMSTYQIRYSTQAAKCMDMCIDTFVCMHVCMCVCWFLCLNIQRDIFGNELLEFIRLCL